MGTDGLTKLPDYSRRMIILSGAPQSGKTKLLQKLIPLCRAKGLSCAGILAEGLWETGERSGFDLVDIGTGATVPLARRVLNSGTGKRIPFTFFSQGLQAGARALAIGCCGSADVVIVDEVGHQELAGRCWYSCLEPLLALTRPFHIWVVRTSLVEQVCRSWHIHSPRVIMADEADAFDKLLNEINMVNGQIGRLFKEK